MKATFDSITITLGERQLTFTAEEAEALRRVLNEKLGRPERIIERQAPIRPHVDWNPPPPPPLPSFQWPNITCLLPQTRYP